MRPGRAVGALLTAFGAVAFAAWIYWMVGQSPMLTGVRPIFFERGLFQHASTLLFSVAVAISVRRLLWLRRELQADALPVEGTGLLAVADVRQILSRHDEHLDGRVAEAQRDVLAAFAQGRDADTVLERVARDTDAAIVEGGKALSPFTQTLPLIGLLGTVVGLSSGIGEFSAVSAADSLEGVRDGLQAFAASISTAFDTTLLALAFLIALWPCALILRAQEQRLRARIRSTLLTTVGCLDVAAQGSSAPGASLSRGVERAVREVNNTLHARHDRLEKLMESLWPMEVQILRGPRPGATTNGVL